MIDAGKETVSIRFGGGGVDGLKGLPILKVSFINLELPDTLREGPDRLNTSVDVLFVDGHLCAANRFSHIPKIRIFFHNKSNKLYELES